MRHERRGSYEGHSAPRDLRGTGKRLNLTAGQGVASHTHTRIHPRARLGSLLPLTCKSRSWLKTTGWPRDRARAGVRIGRRPGGREGNKRKTRWKPHSRIPTGQHLMQSCRGRRNGEHLAHPLGTKQRQRKLYKTSTTTSPSPSPSDIRSPIQQRQQLDRHLKRQRVKTALPLSASTQHRLETPVHPSTPLASPSATTLFSST
ncbi:hypothetical protein QBC39DRAFT_12661 [Podospora conica]|nr:hypothetical protein QBC39DRAFT_12661 [Schizothecium conicum]